MIVFFPDKRGSAMLKGFRKYTKVIVWLIVFAFILWGGSSLIISQSKGASYAGEVFGKKVTHKEFNEVSKMVSLFSTDDKISVGENSDDKAWLYLVLKREADKKKITVSDEEVRSYIATIFAKRGGIDFRTYELWIRNVLREDPRSFEEQVRTYLKCQKLLREVFAQLSSEANTPNPDPKAIEEWLQRTFSEAGVRKYYGS